MRGWESKLTYLVFLFLEKWLQKLMEISLEQIKPVLFLSVLLTSKWFMLKDPAF